MLTNLVLGLVATSAQLNFLIMCLSETYANRPTLPYNKYLHISLGENNQCITGTNNRSIPNFASGHTGP